MRLSFLPLYCLLRERFVKRPYTLSLQLRMRRGSVVSMLCPARVVEDADPYERNAQNGGACHRFVCNCRRAMTKLMPAAMARAACMVSEP